MAAILRYYSSACGGNGQQLLEGRFIPKPFRCLNSAFAACGLEEPRRCVRATLTEKIETHRLKVVMHASWGNTEEDTLLKCQRGPGISAAFHQLYGPNQMIMILGPSCSPVAHPLSEAIIHWNITFVSIRLKSQSLMHTLNRNKRPHVSPIAASDGFRNRQLYPRFFRLLSSDVSMVPARMEIVKTFGWTKIALLCMNSELFTMVADATEKLALGFGWDIIAYEIMSSDIDKAIAGLKKADARIIFAGFYPGVGINVLCAAYRAGFYGSKILWIMNSWIENNWVTEGASKTKCTAEQLLMTLGNALYVGQMLFNPAKGVDVFGRNQSSLDKEFFGFFNNTEPEGSTFRILTYDSMIVAGLALNCTLTKLIESGSHKRLQDFSFNDLGMANMITDCVSNTSFSGLSGKITFNEAGSTQPNIIIQQQQGPVRQDIGYYLSEQKKLVWMNGGPVWPDGKPPVDSKVIMLKQMHVSRPLYISMSVVACFGIMQAIAFLCFNVVLRTNRLIKMSSPNINNLVLIGCMLTYVTVLFADVSGIDISVSSVCMIRLCTYNIGFTMAFGALFAKTWRIHAILTSTKRKNNMIKDSSLMVMVAVIVLIVAAIILTWQTVDWYTEIQTNITLPMEVSADKDVVVVSQMYRCYSKYNLYFTAALYGIQGIMMIFGAFLAWETRKVKLDALNDSKQIAISIYNVVVLSLLGAVISLAVDDDVNVTYGAISALQIMGTIITINTVFMPKVIAFKRGETATGPIMEPTMGDGSSRMDTMHHQRGLAGSSDPASSKSNHK
ncbi:hypothetical protein CAPTEDRAFT_205658 [Capitella teleta]|uniref:G-protein coupled receptors family 3 profile domain-containing protein n=1 Tax=Capitella teleta TaxID=283909 RepID=R7TF73_CAPTE|nr:hypothetical protein CAPTEDRAFT_205658 [Capitella teleta]|eukprot:ELT90201.1 hypothetical protein CAPTEDRAFT_205658 [Capitella teleta]